MCVVCVVRKWLESTMKWVDSVPICSNFYLRERWQFSPMRHYRRCRVQSWHGNAVVCLQNYVCVYWYVRNSHFKNQYSPCILYTGHIQSAGSGQLNIFNILNILNVKPKVRNQERIGEQQKGISCEWGRKRVRTMKDGVCLSVRVWVVPRLSQREFHVEIISGKRQNDLGLVNWYCVPAKLAKNWSWVVIWHAFSERSHVLQKYRMSR